MAASGGRDIFLGSVSAQFEFDSRNGAAGISEAKRQLGTLEGAFSSASSAGINELGKLGKRLDNIGGQFQAAGSAMNRSFTLPIVAGAAAAVASILSFEDNLANVRKTTGATVQELEGIGSALLEMSKHTRTSVTELTEIATIGGQIGIASKDIVGFTDSMNKLNVALGDEFTGGAEEVTNAVGGLRAIFKDIKTDNVQDDLLVIGNALNVLGAEGLATGPVVSDFASRIGGMTSVLGNSAGDILGLSATLQELQVNAERGGSAVGRIMQDMATNIEDFAKVAGISGKAFKDLVNRDINEAFIKVIEGANKSAKSTTDFAEILDKLGLTGVGNQEIFSKLAGNVDLLRKKQTTANKALGETNSIMSEYNVKNNTGAANLQKLRNRLVVVAQDAAPALLSVLNSLVSIVQGAVNWFSALTDSQKKMVVWFGLTVAAIGPVVSLIGNLVTIAGTAARALAFLGGIGGATTAATGLAGAGAAAAGAATAGAGLAAVLTGPVGIALFGTAALSAVLIGNFIGQGNHTDAVTVASMRLKASLEQLKTAQDNLSTSQLNEEGALLRVERAQENYNDAVKRYGPDSLEAREAAHYLKLAQKDLSDAQDKTRDSLEKLKQKQNEVARNKELKKDAEEKAKAIDGITKSADGAVTSINKLARKIEETNKAGTKINLAPLLKAGNNYKGTKSWKGGLTWVGERGPELINLPQGTRIFDNDTSEKLARGVGSVNANGMFNTVNTPNDSVKPLINSAKRAATTGDSHVQLTIMGDVVNETPQAANAWWDRVGVQLDRQTELSNRNLVGAK